MGYFKDVNIGDEVYSLVYGIARVEYVVPQPSRVEGFYALGVVFGCGKRIHYTEDGVADWNKKLHYQTLYYENDRPQVAEMLASITGPVEGAIDINNLEGIYVKCPSGTWLPATDCPKAIVKKAIKSGITQLFRAVR